MSVVLEDPNADKLATGLWVRLVKCYGSVLREVREGQGRRSSVTLSQFDVLARLLRHPRGMTAGELSEALLVTAGSVTGLVSRLEARGLVSREAPKSDRRVRMLRLTPAGRRLAKSEVARHERWLGEIFSALPRKEQVRASRSLESLHRAMEKRRDD